MIVTALKTKSKKRPQRNRNILIIMFQKILFSFILVVTTFSVVIAQSQITEINGREVEFKDDGTWEYVDDDGNYEDEDDYEEETDNDVREKELRNNRATQASEDFDSRRSNSERKRTPRRTPKCSDLIKADFMLDLSGIQTVSEEVFVIGKNSFFMNWSNNRKEGLMLVIQFKTAQCISNTDKISFSFRDLSENFTVSNISKNNCYGLIQINDEKAIRTLKSEKIKSISIRTKQGISTDYLNDTTSRNFLESTKCIYNTTMSN